MVHIILTTIKKCAKDKTTGTISRDKLFTEERIVKLNKVMIRDIDKWDVAKLPEFLFQGFTKENDKKQKADEENSQPKFQRQDNLKKKPSMTEIQEDVDIIEYAPHAFQHIRDLDGIT